jgi:hypothetical protein
MRFFSAAQSLGYVAFVLGVSAFVQKRDRRLKGLIAAESIVYALHFLLLGNLAASVSALSSGFRTMISLKTRSLAIAVVIIVVNIALALAVANDGAQWLPVIASCAATLAIFRLEGVPLRVVLLGCTLLWLANNILSGSIGGTLLESTIAVVNITTMVRIVIARPSPAASHLERVDSVAD